MPLSIVGTFSGSARRNPPVWNPPAPGNILFYGTVEMLSEPNGTGIASWGTPVAMTQATAAAQPTKQADHVFVGADDTMATPAFDMTDSGSVTFVSILSETADRPIFDFGISWVFIAQNRRFRVFGVNGTAFTASGSSFAPASGQYHTVTGRWTANTVSIVIDGVERASTPITEPLRLQSGRPMRLNPIASGQIGSVRYYSLHDKYLSIAEHNEVAAKWQ